MLLLRDDCQYVIENIHNFSDVDEIRIYLDKTGTNILYHLHEFQNLRHINLVNVGVNDILSDPFSKTLSNCTNIESLRIQFIDVVITHEFLMELELILIEVSKLYYLFALQMYFNLYKWIDGNSYNQSDQPDQPDLKDDDKKIIGDTIIKIIPNITNINRLFLANVIFDDKIFDALLANQSTIFWGHENKYLRLSLTYDKFIKYCKNINATNFNFLVYSLTMSNYNINLFVSDDYNHYPVYYYFISKLQSNQRHTNIVYTHNQTYILNRRKYHTTLYELSNRYYIQ